MPVVANPPQYSIFGTDIRHDLIDHDSKQRRQASQGVPSPKDATFSVGERRYVGRHGAGHRDGLNTTQPNLIRKSNLTRSDPTYPDVI